MQPKDLPQHSLLQAQQSIELPQCPENILEQQNQEKMLMVQPIYTMDQNEQPNQVKKYIKEYNLIKYNIF